ncbi:phage head-tail connector protein [Anaerotignum sp.]|uniref:phage head-tail connector protein n=1 Tax=Anaerotignum sp. TaxID=2039241 RepID=UPI0028970436|nr:hypothetical protein [Anaerotignum sp.]
MVAKIRAALRITHSNFDSEIQGDIDACLLDLKRVGIPNPNQEDALIYKAVEMYCKWQYDFGGKGDKFEQAYTNLRMGLALCGEYNV